MIVAKHFPLLSCLPHTATLSTVSYVHTNCKKSLIQNEEGYRVSIIDLQALSDAIFFGLGNLGLKIVAMSYEMSLCFGST